MGERHGAGDRAAAARRGVGASGGGRVAVAGAVAVLRPVTPLDRVFCWQLMRDTMRPHVEAIWGWDDADQRQRFEQTFEPHLLRIVELDGAAVGMLKVDFATTPVRLLNIQIAPAHQRKGLGTALVADVVRRAGARPVWLQVLKSNPARALYQRLGFRVVDETATHWRMVRDPAA